MLRQIAARLGLAPAAGREVGSADGLARYLDRQSAYVTQRCVTEHLRLRVGLRWETMADDHDFRTAVETCRWAGYAAVLGGVAETVLARLRQLGAGPGATGTVAGAAAAALARYATQQQAIDTAAAASAIGAGLERAMLAPPRPAVAIAERIGQRLFELLPIHTDLSAADREAFVNAVRFALCGVADRMDRELDLQPLAAG